MVGPVQVSVDHCSSSESKQTHFYWNRIMILRIKGITNFFRIRMSQIFIRRETSNSEIFQGPTDGSLIIIVHSQP